LIPELTLLNQGSTGTTIPIDIPEIARELIRRFMPGPLTIILRASPDLPELVTAGTGTVGIRIPDHPVALELLRAAETPIVAPSANPSGEPAPSSADEVLAYLGGRIEYILDSGPSQLKVASTVVDLTSTPPQILRHGAISDEELAPFISR
jgi:L-threonylcarbamoyladenylate synthase